MRPPTGSSWGRLATVSIHIFAAITSAASSGLTEKHEAGRCAIRGDCGSEGFFGPQLPCPDNGKAEVPDLGTRAKLVEICGEEWRATRVCCKPEQLDTLESNLQRADQLISSCPACRKNFRNLFCTFTCSPDQSLFVNVTETKEKSGKQLVTELDHLVSDAYGKGFYDSCKDVKFGAVNQRAMDLIGGGAKNSTEFLKFLGDKKFLGSPFQMDFPSTTDKDKFPGMTPMDKDSKACNDPDFRCPCVDCPDACPELPEVKEEKHCYVGYLPCLSFGVIVVYAAFLLLLVLAVSGHVAYQKHAKSKNERLRLLQDAAPSDDEDEGDIVHNAGMMERPQRHYYLNTLCDRAFCRLGEICAEFPAITISMSLALVIFLSFGWFRFAIETDPVKLWVAPDSAAAQEKKFFDNNFGPFFRAEQAFLVNETVDGQGPVLSYENLKWWIGVENRIERLVSGGVTFDDVCFKPLGDACVVQSVTQYFDDGSHQFTESGWKDTLEACIAKPVDCLPKFQQPLNPKMLLGGYDDNALDAKALVTTWVVNNHQEGTEEVKKAMEWEDALKDILLETAKEAEDRGLRLSFNTEVSLEQELNKSTNTDAKIVVISYVIMFLYASFALGSTTLAIRSVFRDPANALVQSKFMLGIVGIIIVLMSVSASVGLFSALGIKVTLIIAEVIPFLVLAVGVDNIFLIVHEFERVNLSHPESSIPNRMSRALGRMGPSILLSATTETAAFALGAAVGMPAVRNFAAYAAGAVFINAILQITMFVAVLALNQRRVEAGRADCFPCVRVRARDHPTATHGMIYGIEDEGGLQRFIRKYYAPALLGRKVKIAIITVFLGLTAAGVALIPKIELGLDQRIAIPSDSYLIQYFNDLDSYFGVGPPVYFVTRELNVTQRQHQQELCGRFLSCNEFSLSNVLELESRRPDVSYISDSTASWVDDFFLWLNPAFDSCCVSRGNACFDDRDPPWNPTLEGMPEGQEYIDYLSRWLKSNPGSDCVLAGKAAYGNALVYDANRLTINASHFRTSHSPLRSQSDFISAYRSARRIASDFSRENNVDVFPYSKFYIFFDQYVSIVRLAASLLGSALAIVFVLSATLLGSLRTGLVVTVTVAMTLTCILGSMAVAGVSLNAVSLVNLIISLGIALEFCAHIARAFTYPSTSVMERAPRHAFARVRSHSASHNGSYAMGSPGAVLDGASGRDARAWTALVNVGASVFSGITITKFVGVAVLAFTRSKIFEIYYFRVWVALVIFAASHALIFLPVALSLFGGRGYVDPESEGGLEQDLRSRRYPALLADDDYDSDDY